MSPVRIFAGAREREGESSPRDVAGMKSMEETSEVVDGWAFVAQTSCASTRLEMAEMRPGICGLWELPTT